MDNYDKQSIVECPQNHNLITNFSVKDRWLYEAAILHYGGDDVFITDDAYWVNGILDESMNALRCKNPDVDCGYFWEVFAAVEQALVK